MAPEFWNWSFEEMAQFDLPSVLKYVRDQTGRPSHYIGHSQGGMIGVLAFQDPNISDLITKADFLARFPFCAVFADSLYM